MFVWDNYEKNQVVSTAKKTKRSSFFNAKTKEIETNYRERKSSIGIPTKTRVNINSEICTNMRSDVNVAVFLYAGRFHFCNFMCFYYYGEQALNSYNLHVRQLSNDWWQLKQQINIPQLGASMKGWPTSTIGWDNVFLPTAYWYKYKKILFYISDQFQCMGRGVGATCINVECLIRNLNIPALIFKTISTVWQDNECVRKCFSMPKLREQTLVLCY